MYEEGYPASRGPSIFLDKSGRGRDIFHEYSLFPVDFSRLFQIHPSKEKRQKRPPLFWILRVYQVYCGHIFSQQFLAKQMRTKQKREKLVSNRTDSSVWWMSSKQGRSRWLAEVPFLFPTYLGRLKGLCSRGRRWVFQAVKYIHLPWLPFTGDIHKSCMCFSLKSSIKECNYHINQSQLLGRVMLSVWNFLGQNGDVSYETSHWWGVIKGSCIQGLSYSFWIFVNNFYKFHWLYFFYRLLATHYKQTACW